MKPEPEERVLRYLHEDVQRKQVVREPKRMRNVISDLLVRRGYAQVNAADRCLEVWTDVVGPDLARLSRPGRIRKRVLQVIVTNSAAVQELTMRRQDILRRLAKQAPELNIDGLKFRVGVLG